MYFGKDFIMPTVRMRNQAKCGMTFWGFFIVMALVVVLSSVLGGQAAYAQTPPPLPSAETTNALQQYFNEKKDQFLSKGKQYADFAKAYGDCLFSGSQDCSMDTVANKVILTNLQDELASSGSWVRQIVSKLDASCWSCETYTAIFGALMGLAGETFSFFVETKEIIALAVVVTQIILVIKFFLIIGAPAAQDFNSAYGDVFKYIGRVAVIFLLFLTPLTAQAFKTNTGNSADERPAKVMFVDGPLLLGTQVGKMLVEETSQITKARLQDRTCSAPTTGSGALSDMAKEHLKIACKMLWSFHSMGVAGIASGTWLITEAPRTMNNPSWGALAAVVVAGFIMTLAFLFFTITFGLRYLDALVRAGLTLALLPVFLFFWIFQSTRSIAHAGLRSLLYMGAVFAASGFVFVICNEIMNFGFSKALGSSVSADGSQAFLNAMAQGGFNWFVGTGSNGDEANWLSFFYLMGAWGLSTKAASIVFQLAEEITQFQGGLTGAGKETEADLKEKAGTGWSMASGGAKLAGSGAMSLGSGAIRMMR
jgi:hypothetical protein